MTRHRLDLSFNRPPLTSNQRHHWAVRARTVREVRSEVAWRAHATGLGTQQHITVELHYHPADRRRRDADNLVPTLKAACDGLVDAGLVADDTPAYMTKHMPVIHPPDPGRGPACWLTITTGKTTP